MVTIKRAYERASKQDGIRILVDRLWPRGLTRRAAAIDTWAKDLSPSEALRRWFGHDPGRWPEFRRRFRREQRGSARLAALARQALRRRITLVYSARDPEHNNAVVLKTMVERLQKRMRDGGQRVRRSPRPARG